LATSTTYKSEVTVAYVYGIDVRIARRVDLRVIEVDYEPIFAKDRNTPVDGFFTQRVNGKTAQNVTFGIGLVWR
jgi:hypothetical protein